MVAADAWEEANQIERAASMRARAWEIEVGAAAHALERQLEDVARERGQVAYAVIEPSGDYWLRESDPTSRGKTLRIEIPERRRFNQPRFFSANIERTDAGWYGMYGTATGWGAGWPQKVFHATTREPSDENGPASPTAAPVLGRIVLAYRFAVVEGLS